MNNFFTLDDGHKLWIFRKGKELYPDVLRTLRTAKKEICIEIYIFSYDDIGKALRDILIERAYRGVKVRIIYDPIGCRDNAPGFFEEMTKFGIQVQEFNPYKPIRKYIFHWLEKLLARTHRKLLIIDDKISYLGGINFGEEFLDWEDLHIKVEGPIVANAKISFEKVWNKTYKEPLTPEPILKDDLGEISLLDNFPKQNNSQYNKFFKELFAAAKEEILLSQAYFFPHKKLRKELLKAVKRGVKITLIVPNRSDLFWSDVSGMSLYPTLLRRGIKIFRYFGEMLHTKMALIDNKFLFIASANLDQVNLLKSLELGVIIKNKQVINRVREIFEENKKASKEFTLEEWKKVPFSRKALSRILFTLRRIM